MSLSLPTLLLVDLYILALVGVLMFFAWYGGRREPTLGYMAAMLLLGALSTFLIALRSFGLELLAIVAGNMVVALSCALLWTSMRVFAGRSPYWPGVAAGAVIWLLLCLWPAFLQSMVLRIQVHSALTVVYCLLAAAELWRSRQRLEVPLRPTLALLLFHAGFYTLRIFVDRGEVPVVPSGTYTTLFTLLVFETMLVAVGLAFTTLTMVKDRAELKFRSAALSDPLTGIGNRRAFMDSGERLLRLCAERGEPVALLVCDLDNFKRLNDAYGHPVGDRALQEFSRITASRMRRQDVFGRIGGEEFACLLIGAGTEAACQVAERIRREFAEVPFVADGLLSVSIGVATSEEGGYELARLLSLADQALYLAKAKGRNRIELSAPGSGREGRGHR
ncbi:diguanylate cyclase (GGDEF) domain-containing protein [Pseudomonas citronellolis]|uniref:diguanylate cyclase n=1 Tax=Pseudomonas citronellolis TaxID=53408 RepID=A0AAQ1KEU6_9PSED|nr:GGDEF domain-containing protein [Pseudomonas citronellolis]MCP1602279.1 diguanylate cyclase (GGDEF)-like protein [Pseudomonas citronellolis]MCP1641745.1 diguanylate cyclase (GGDEF)-like protein [Pseudomonas citronellolis]MCP1652998.1 diguanylate cyclase (GGDEF)-like protein [Pseudomonas citronellolis]MCP1664663.1 diguanylate cyclase (GGDEF)-like protein [Pseudomonas citronellolis]MCP1695878.1 diguanylate cyclase (GGDEF)-like protein [Pseudomonas citronellolis]